jgi:hypothetical protein
MEKLLISNLWPEIQRLSRKARMVQAAIAFFSGDTYLHLKKGDTLIVNASDRAIGSGETSARLLWRLFRKGVILRNLPSLHAKILLLDNKAVIGSGNASSYSANRWIEAAVLSDSLELVSQVRSFMQSLAQKTEQLTEESVRRLLKIRVQRPAVPGSNWKGSFGRTWIVGSLDLPEFEKTLPSAEAFFLEITKSHYLSKSAVNGDQLIVICSKQGKRTPYRVQPPSPLMWYEEEDKKKRLCYAPRLSAPLRTLSWREFQSLLKQAEIRKRIAPLKAVRLSLKEALELERLWPRSDRI